MTFLDHARQRTSSAFDALRDRDHQALRQELDALRAALDERLAALERALPPRDDAEVEHLVQELSNTAREEADALVEQARAEAEHRSEAALAETKQHAARELDIERDAKAAVLANLEDANRQIEDANRQIDDARKELDGAKRQVEEMHHAAQSRADALKQIDDLRQAADSHAAATADLEAQLARERAANVELTGIVATTQAAASAARDAAHGHAADVESARDRMRALEAEVAHLRQAAADAESRLEAAAAVPAVDPVSLAERVKHALRAFSGATSAQAIFDALVEQLAHEYAAVGLFLNRRNRLEGWRSRGLDSQIDISYVIVPLSMDSPLSRAVASRVVVAVDASQGAAKLGVFGQEVAQAFAWPIVVSGNVVAVAYVEEPAGHVPSAGDRNYQIAEILIEQVGRCLVTGRKAATAAEPAVASRESTPPPAPAAAPRPVPTTAPGVPPVAGQDREEPARDVAKLTTAEVSSVPLKPVPMPEPLAGAAAPRETQPAPVVFAGAAREVDRIKIRSGVEVSVDGTTGQLIDLSTLGAQVVSPKSIRPQQLVRVVLQGVNGPLTCKGRIVWARFEKSGMYRAGIRFSEGDPAALQTFLDDFGEQPLALPARAV
jgi:hypothetical protein